MLERLKEDIQTIFAKDPAVKNTRDAILCYPGLRFILELKSEEEFLLTMGWV